MKTEEIQEKLNDINFREYLPKWILNSLEELLTARKFINKVANNQEIYTIYVKEARELDKEIKREDAKSNMERTG